MELKDKKIKAYELLLQIESLNALYAQLKREIIEEINKGILPAPKNNEETARDKKT